MESIYNFNEFAFTINEMNAEFTINEHEINMAIERDIQEVIRLSDN